MELSSSIKFFYTTTLTKIKQCKDILADNKIGAYIQYKNKTTNYTHYFKKEMIS